MAQLVEQSLPTPDFVVRIQSLRKIYIERLLSTVLKFEETKRKKRSRMAHLKKSFSLYIQTVVLLKARRSDEPVLPS